jgi:serine/threonine protein kinase
LSTDLALGIACDVADALAHLHQRGVMHGDLYAHNILIDPVHGQAQLGDFGAATRLPMDTPELRQSLLALEVRALGCLLEELALAVQPSSPALAMTPWHHEAGTSSTADDSSADAAVQTLQALARACLSDQPRQRPTAAEVAQALQTLKP